VNEQQRTEPAETNYEHNTSASYEQPRPQFPTETEQMSNPPRLVSAFGKAYEIRRFSMAQVFDSVEFVAPFGFVLQNIMALPKEKYIDEKDGKEKVRVVATPEQMTQFAVTALSISGPSALGLISVATGEPVEWLRMPDKNPFDGLEILSAVLEKNLDFFTPENIGKLTKLLNGLSSATLAFSGKTSTT
jgi:hypothetical protein